MKILYIISNTNPDGSTQSFLTLLEGVVKLGNHAVVIIPSKDDIFSEKMLSLGVPTYTLPLESNIWPGFFGIKRLLGYPYVLVRHFFRQISLVKDVMEIVNIEHPDIIHTNVGPLDIGHYASRVCKLPHVWHIREYGDKDFSIKVFPCKKVYRKKLRADWTIPITKALQKYNNLTDCERSTVIYNGVRSVDSAQYDSSKQKYFVCASRISKEKGHERTIRVFASFVKKNPEYRLVILGVGFDYYVNRLKYLIKDLEIEENVSFEGFKSDVDSYLRHASALLVASPFEGFGRMTAEAAFAGCLVIGYNSAGTKEILEETGGFLWNNDMEYLQAMEDVANMTEEEYAYKALYAQNKAKGLFSQESYISSVVTLYSKILSR